jgi:hypothetical protein
MTVSLYRPEDGTNVDPGTPVSLSGWAMDPDTCFESGGTFQIPDSISLRWSASGGTFSTATDQGNATWIAPAVEGIYTITLTADDAGNENLPSGDSGDREDGTATDAITIRVGDVASIEWQTDTAIPGRRDHRSVHGRPRGIGRRGLVQRGDSHGQRQAHPPAPRRQHDD